MPNEIIQGQYKVGEINYIKANLEKTDKEIAAALNREPRSIANLRKRLDLKKSTKKRRSDITEDRSAFLGSLSDTERREEFAREIRNSSRYKSLDKSLTPAELELYVEKYVDLMMDPTIETMTTMEKDALHQVFITEIRINRYLQEEREDVEVAKKQKRNPISRSKEIKECQEIIAKYHKSLNIEREQRLKNQSDQAITFTNLIRDLKNPDVRRRAGEEAAMLKYIEAKFYNDRLGTNIVSGKNQKFNIGSMFKSGKEPLLSADFTPDATKEVQEQGGEINGVDG